MKDISTDDLIQTLIIKTQAAERAASVYAVHPTAQNAKAQNAREREKKDALRALRTHLRDVELGLRRTQRVKLPPGYLLKSTKLSGRTIGALKRWKVQQPEHMTLRDLLRIPEIGVQAVANIAARVYSSTLHPVNWPELEPDDED